MTRAARRPPGVRAVGYEPHAPGALREEIARADVVVAPPQWPVVTRWLRHSGARVVYDLYDPETLETLELFRGRRGRSAMVALTVDRLEDALRTGHHFMCASESQRDLWIGALLASRLLTPASYDRDPTLRDVLDLVPFGVPASPPAAGGGPGIRDAFPQIGPDDEIVLWNGGLWRWLDPATAVRAIGRLAERRPGVRLVFMGASDKAAAERRAARRPRPSATSRSSTTEWVPYAQRAAWLLEANCALVTGVDHLETRFAFRTRMLDCFWAGLPVVCTSGDELAERVARDGLGAVVNPGDDAALADALEGRTRPRPQGVRRRARARGRRFRVAGRGGAAPPLDRLGRAPTATGRPATAGACRARRRIRRRPARAGDARVRWPSL